VDREVAGPYVLWNHEHRFVSHDGGTTMRDRVTYALPLAWVGRLASWTVVKRDVEKSFGFRAESMRRLFPG
jgi:ligand-binding SRPBCC domain-containing protein